MKKLIIALTAVLPLALASCNDYLDKLPDDRAEVNSVEKVQLLLTSAYPDISPIFVLEYSSDNVTDNGIRYTAQPDQEKIYCWEQVESDGNDDPKNLWQSCYAAVATANLAIASCEQMGLNDQTYPVYAEALLCRAFGMFQLTNTFCMSWNEAKADEFPGVPYPTEPNKEANERGTLRQTYEQINKDIELALAHLDDSYLTTPKYHFNAKAAYAFAARFNLYYQRWDKVVEYASRALGSTPSSQLRNISTYGTLIPQDMSNAWINSGEQANFLLVTAYSLVGRTFRSGAYMRYAHNKTILGYETFWAYAPWAGSVNTSGDNTLYEAHMMYGSEYCTYLPKIFEKFEITDKVNQTGYPHIVDPVFTADETLLCRAEAYAMTGQTAQSLADLNTWINAHCAASNNDFTRNTVTESSLNEFFATIKECPVTPNDDTKRNIKKVLHPQGFTVAEGTQTNLIRLILHARRIETWQQGLRFIDCKRWGISYTHPLEERKDLVFEPGDLRGAVQLPIDVISAGLSENPRAQITVQSQFTVPSHLSSKLD